MDGPTYHPTSLPGFMCVTTFVPGGANGVTEKLNSPKIYVYVDIFELERDARKTFRVIFA